jgi:hypothetical protein
MFAFPGGGGKKKKKKKKKCQPHFVNSSQVHLVLYHGSTSAVIQSHQFASVIVTQSRIYANKSVYYPNNNAM